MQLLNGFEALASGSTMAAATSGYTGNDAFDSVSIGTLATLQYSNTHTVRGSNGLSVATPAVATTSFVTWSTAYGTQTVKVYFRAYVYVTTSVAFTAIRFNDSTGSRCIDINISATGKPYMVNAGGSTITGSTFTNSVNASGWSRIEGWVVPSTTVGQASVSLYNTMDSLTATETITTAASQVLLANTGQVQFGVAGGNVASVTLWMDAIGVSTVAALGPAAVTDADTGSGADSGAKVLIQGSDSGAGADSTGLSVTVANGDAGAGVDTGVMAPLTPGEHGGAWTWANSDALVPDATLWNAAHCTIANNSSAPVGGPPSSLRLTSLDTSGFYIYYKTANMTAITPGNWYTFDALVYLNGAAARSNYVQLAWLDASGNTVLDLGVVYNNSSLSPGRWYWLSSLVSIGSYQAPSGAATIRLLYQFNTPVAAGDTLDIAYQGTMALSDTATTGLPGTDTGSGADSGKVAITAADTGSGLDSTGLSVTVANGDTSSGADSGAVAPLTSDEKGGAWTWANADALSPDASHWGAAHATIANNSAAPVGGPPSSIRLTATDTLGFYTFANLANEATATPGNWYTFDALVYLTGGAARSTYVQLAWLDSSGTVVSDLGVVYSYNALSPGRWYWLSSLASPGYYQAPSGAARIRLLYQFNTPVVVGDTVDIAYQGAMALSDTATTGLPGSDTGSGADSGKVSPVVSDAGSGADSTGLSVTIANGDTGTGAESAPVGIAPGGDTGAGTGLATIAVVAADTAGGTDSANTGISATDTGTGVEGTGLSASVAASDASSGADSATLSIPISDTSSGSDSATMAVAPADTGAATEAVSAGLLASDPSSGADSAGAGVPATDTGSGADGTTLAVSVAVADVGAEAEAAGLSLLSGDTGSGADAVVITASVQDGDFATSVELAGLSFTVADTATATEDAGLSAFAGDSDSATGVELAGLEAGTPDSDNGTLADDAGISAVAGDSVVVTDGAGLSVVTGDNGSWAEYAGISLSSSDSATSVELAGIDSDGFTHDTWQAHEGSAVGVTSGGLGSGAESVSLRVASGDSCSGSDSASVAVHTGDGASAVSGAKVTSAIIASDLGSWAEMAHAEALQYIVSSDAITITELATVSRKSGGMMVMFGRLR